MWKTFVCFILSILIVAGCSFHNKNNSAENTRGGTERLKYQRLSSEPDNQGKKQVELSGQTQTLGKEINTAKKIMKSYKGYKLVSVSINGNNMWVTAHTRNSMSAQERMKREAQVHKKLEQALPQYNINVKLEEK
ncbi:hypothetical protein [Bacillus sp. FJAT-49736]|uniref:hypothetical protein n=1 Tax=Bacillus sp. FJAT-49736 TaxID=2833582 RepID=UPI001BC8CDC4|nr:hypothetical protein [Bacillus sp. FJAT-49736]MBS4175406.1 hypothetical protein [Bacillus sp. FJAT-49736]